MTRADFFRFPILPLILALSGCGADPENKEPTTATNQWSGHTYLLDITAANWAVPRGGVGREIDPFVPNFLMRIDGDAPDRFDVTMGTAKADGAQDPCNQTGVIEGTSDGGGVTISAPMFPLHIQYPEEGLAVDAYAYDMSITNILPNGGAPAQDGVFTTTMDFREVYELFTALPQPTPEAVCISFEDAYDIPCAPCKDGEPFCLTLQATDLGAVESSAAIEPVVADDVDPVACTPMVPPAD